MVTTVPLRSRRRKRGQLLQKVQHIVPAVPLLSAGVQALADHPHWFHVFAAGVLLAEAGEHWHLTHHWRRPTLVMAAITLLLGLLHGRIDAWSDDRRSLKVSNEGIYVGGRFFFTSFDAKWDELEAIEIDERRATIRAAGGRRRVIDLTDCEDATAVRGALGQAARRLMPNA